MADVEFKALRQKLIDNNLLTESDSRYWILYTKQIAILFWHANSLTYFSSYDTIAYTNCKIGIKGYEPIKSQIWKWQRIEKLIENMPPDTEEIPYSDIETLKIWENQK